MEVPAERTIHGGEGIRERRGRIVRFAIALTVTLTTAAVAAGPAAAVFPGANGRLFATGALYDPPDPNPVTYPWSGLSEIRFSSDDLQVTGVHGAGNPGSSVWVANLDGSNAHQVSTNPYTNGVDELPTWSPDSKQLAFIRGGKPLPCPPPSTDKCPASELVLLNLQTGATHDLLGPALNSLLYPEWSPVPDSDQLVVMRTADSGSTNDVDLVNTDTGAIQTVASGNTLNYARFAPDGNSLVAATQNFESGSTETIKVIPLNADGRSLSFTVNTPDGVVFPTFAPDGQAITYSTCTSGGNCGIWNATLPAADAPPGTAPTITQVIKTSSYFPYQFDWEPLVNEPVITIGPSGTVKDTDATFEFSIPSSEKGTYQCKLDDGGWEDGCTSPKTYSGVDDGDHTFSVRFYESGQKPDDAPVASRTWTVDTTPPEAIIDEAPSGSTTSTTASIFFHSTEPDGATFKCSVDGGAEFDCSSPQVLTGLDVGEHTFAVKAIDAVGNEQETATEVSWEVTESASGGGGSSGGGSGGGGSTGGGSPGGGGGSSGGLPPRSDCSGGRFTKFSFGNVVVVGRAGTCFVRTKEGPVNAKWTAVGTISLNGVELTSPGVITIDQHGDGVDIDVPAGTTLGLKSFTWTLPSRVDIPLAGSAASFLLPDPKGTFKIAGIAVDADPDFDLSKSDGGSSIITLNLKLPAVFQGAAGGDAARPSDMTFKFKFIASNDKGVRFAFNATVTNLWLFGEVEVPSLTVGLDPGPPLTFDGSATMKFPGVSGKYTLSLGLSGEGEQPFPLVNKLALEASELQKPIAEGVFLQRLGGRFVRCVGLDKQAAGLLSASAGVSFGPKLDIPGVFSGEPASLDGTVTLSLCEPKSIQVSGSGKIVDVALGSASAKYTWSTGRIDLEGKIGLSVAGWAIAAALKNAFFDIPGKVWNAEGTANLTAPGIFGTVLNGKGDIVVSTNGVAGCFGAVGGRFGFGMHWGGKWNTFGGDCDVGPYRAGGSTASIARTGRLRAHAASGFSIPAHARIEVLAAHGAGGPPKVVVTGPGGVRIDTPADATGVQTPQTLLVQNPDDDTTYVILFSPAAGAWSVAPEPGAVAPAGVQIADGLPPVQVSARVTAPNRVHATHGRRRVLTWSLRPLAGQRVTFVERGADVTHTLASTDRAHGTLTFTPAPAAGRGRQIVALVAQNGLPRDQPVVAHFLAPRPPRLRAVRGLRLRGPRLTWPGQPGAARYSLMLRSADGATSSAITRRPSLPVPRSMRHRTLTVSISALSATGTVGPLHAVSVRPPRH